MNGATERRVANVGCTYEPTAWVTPRDLDQSPKHAEETHSGFQTEAAANAAAAPPCAIVRARSIDMT